MTTAFWYGKGMLHVMSDLNVLSGGLKLALCTSSYVPNQDTDETFANITNEVVGTGYTAGGQSVANFTITYTGGSNVIALKFDDVSWAASTITARIAVLYKDTGNPSTSYLIGWQDKGSDVSSTGGVFLGDVDASGFLKTTVS